MSHVVVAVLKAVKMSWLFGVLVGSAGVPHRAPLSRWVVESGTGRLPQFRMRGRMVKKKNHKCRVNLTTFFTCLAVGFDAPSKRVVCHSLSPFRVENKGEKIVLIFCEFCDLLSFFSFFFPANFKTMSHLRKFHVIMCQVTLNKKRQKQWLACGSLR